MVPELLSVGLFQELVLLRGDPNHLVPRAKWHLPSASAAELPLAHELPGEQVSETRWRHHGMGKGLRVGLLWECRGRLRPPRWVEHREHCFYAHSQHFPLCS